MNQTMHPCESCSMPIETGTYCSYCVTASGELQPFDERFENTGGLSNAPETWPVAGPGGTGYTRVHGENACLEGPPAVGGAQGLAANRTRDSMV